MNSQSTIPVNLCTAQPLTDSQVDTRSNAHLQASFAVIGALVGANLLHFNLNDRQWVDRFELAVTQTARVLAECQG